MWNKAAFELFSVVQCPPPFIFQSGPQRAASALLEFLRNVNSWSPAPDLLNQKPSNLCFNKPSRGPEALCRWGTSSLGLTLGTSGGWPQSPLSALRVPRISYNHGPTGIREAEGKNFLLSCLFFSLISRSFSRTELELRNILLAYYTSMQRKGGIGLTTPCSMASTWIFHIFLRILVCLERPALRFSGFFLERTKTETWLFVLFLSFPPFIPRDTIFVNFYFGKYPTFLSRERSVHTTNYSLQIKIQTNPHKCHLFDIPCKSLLTHRSHGITVFLEVL